MPNIATHAKASTDGVAAAFPVDAVVEGVCDGLDGENAIISPSLVPKYRWPSATAGEPKISVAPVL